MKTPYDAALRLRQREIADIRVSISVEVSQIIVLDERRDAIEHCVRTEREIASRHHDFPVDGFATRMRNQHDALGRDRDASEDRLSQLRAQAIEAYGSLSAIAAAADTHRAEASRAAAVAEQGQLDDFSGARFTRVMSAARRSRTTPEVDL